MWKTNIDRDLQLFQDLMAQYNANIKCESPLYKTRYIKFIQNSEKCSSTSDAEHNDEEKGGEEEEKPSVISTSADKSNDSLVEQIFLETTV